jgi:hypothetical protein
MDAIPLTTQNLASLKRGNKYRVSPKEERTHNGITYASKIEMRRAQFWSAQLGCVVIEQPKFRLGCPENVYIADFLVIPVEGRPWVEDVKGTETPKFKRDKKLWKRYGPLELRIVKWNRSGWKIDSVFPEHVE